MRETLGVFEDNQTLMLGFLFRLIEELTRIALSKDQLTAKDRKTLEDIANECGEVIANHKYPELPSSVVESFDVAYR